MGPMAAHRPYGRGQRGGAQEPLRRGRRSMPACGGRCAGCRSGQGGETVSVSRSVRLSPSPSPSCSCVSGSAGKGGCIVRVVLDALTGLSQDALIGLTLHRFAPWYGVAQGTPRPALPAVLPIALWPDIGAQGNTREAAAVCPGCWGERAVILLPWRLHHLTACPRHRVLLRQRCAGCAEPLRLTAGRGDCARCGAAIAAMPTRSIAGDPDGVEVSALLWRATGCAEGCYPPEGLRLEPDHPLRRLGTPALLRVLRACAGVLLAGGACAEGVETPRLHELDIVDLHDTLVAAWRRLRDGPTREGVPFPMR